MVWGTLYKKVGSEGKGENAGERFERCGKEEGRKGVQGTGVH